MGKATLPGRAVQFSPARGDGIESDKPALSAGDFVAFFRKAWEKLASSPFGELVKVLSRAS